MIEVLVGLGLLGIIASAFLSLISNMSVNVRTLAEKMVARDVDQELTNALNNTDFCGCYMKGNSFNTGDLSNPWIISFTRFPRGYDDPLTCVSTPENIVPPVGTKIQNSNIKTASISMIDVAPQASPGTYSGKFEVRFDPESLTIPLRPILVPVVFTVDNAVAGPLKPFVSCKSVGSAPDLSNCDICIQCSDHDEEGAHNWRDAAEQCQKVNAGQTNWSQTSTRGGDEETGGVRCRVQMKCP